MRRDVHLSAKPESYSNPSSRHIGTNKIFLKQVLNIQAISQYILNTPEKENIQKEFTLPKNDSFSNR